MTKWIKESFKHILEQPWPCHVSGLAAVSHRDTWVLISCSDCSVSFLPELLELTSLETIRSRPTEMLSLIVPPPLSGLLRNARQFEGSHQDLRHSAAGLHGSSSSSLYGSRTGTSRLLSSSSTFMFVRECMQILQVCLWHSFVLFVRHLQ